jgi:hypothetical protein
MDAKVILTPPYIFHKSFSIQNIQGGVRMVLTSMSRLDTWSVDALCGPDGEVLLVLGRIIASHSRASTAYQICRHNRCLDF